MEIALFDHRNKFHTGFQSSLGKSGGFTMTKAGNLKIKQTDLLYSLRIHFDFEEIEKLHLILEDIIVSKNKKKKGYGVLKTVDEILEEKRKQP